MTDGGWRMTEGADDALGTRVVAAVEIPVPVRRGGPRARRRDAVPSRASDRDGNRGGEIAGGGAHGGAGRLWRRDPDQRGMPRDARVRLVRARPAGRALRVARGAA